MGGVELRFSGFRKSCLNKNRGRCSFSSLFIILVNRVAFLPTVGIKLFIKSTSAAIPFVLFLSVVRIYFIFVCSLFLLTDKSFYTFWVICLTDFFFCSFSPTSQRVHRALRGSGLRPRHVAPATLACSSLDRRAGRLETSLSRTWKEVPPTVAARLVRFQRRL